jgi:RNA polymerase sigma-70 factor, ECF subfamily
MDETELLKESQRGDHEAFSQLVQRHERPLTMMIFKMVRDLEEAKDLSQTAFLKAFEALPRFLNSSSFKTWLYKIAVNTVRDHLRKAKPEIVPALIEEIPDPIAPPAEQLHKARELKRMREAVERLPEKQRLTLQLRIYESMDYRDIAVIMGTTEGAARGNFFQAVKNLRDALEGEK